MRSERSTRSSSITVDANCSCACILWADGSSPLHEFTSDAREALYCLPALSLLLALGILSGHADAALVAASGAFAVGFGSFQQFTRHKMAPMVLAAVGMTASAAAGSILGRYETALIVAPA